jgi:hypothetical protein
VSFKTSPKQAPSRVTQVFKTQNSSLNQANQGYRWWEESNPDIRATQLCATFAFLKQGQSARLRQMAVFARLYSGQALFSFIGANMSLMDQYSPLAPNRPTFNLVAAVTDTLVSKITQAKPTPVFLTDNGDYKERNLAKKLNNFILGEFYQTKAYEVGEYILRDALGWAGTGCLKVFETQDHKVGIERVMSTELFVDLQESAHDNPRRLYQAKLYDRDVAMRMWPKAKWEVEKAEKATIDKSNQSSKTVSDLIMVVEGWSLPSSPNAKDGKHTIACSSGELFSEDWNKDKFPFVFLHHRKRVLGFWSMSVAESLMGTQLELNTLLDTISKSIKLMGVPRIFYDTSAKINKAAFGNKIGTLIPTLGNPNTAIKIDTSPPVSADMYSERDRIIQYGFQQEGLSMLSATSQKPEGLDSGEAQRVYQDINSERFAALEKRYSCFYVDLAYQIIDLAKDIATRDGKYETVFVDRKKGRREIDLPKISLLEDPFVIQAYTESSLPKDPAGRLQKVTEMIQSGMIDIQEGRRLLDFPDLGQMETLANAAEERIYMQLDEIVESGAYDPPDQFMPIPKCESIVTQYINLYATCKLEEKKMQMFRDWFNELQNIKQMAVPPPAAMPAPQAAPQPTPTSPLVPNGANSPQMNQ